MGAKDTATIKYMRQNEIFADALNYFVYGGKQVISPDSLEELDTRELDVPYGVLLAKNRQSNGREMLSKR